MSQHIAPTSQESRPDTGEPVTVHGSPTASGSGSSGKQRVPFQDEPPSTARGLHFSPGGQSWSQMEHSRSIEPPSGRVMNEVMSVGASPVEVPTTVVLEEASGVLLEVVVARPVLAWPDPRPPGSGARLHASTSVRPANHPRRTFEIVTKRHLGVLDGPIWLRNVGFIRGWTAAPAGRGACCRP